MDDSIRVSDADRDHVTAQLRDHFAAGRITPGELDERLSAALNAKTFGDLRRADVVILDQIQISAGITAQDEATHRRRVPPHALGVRAVTEPS